MRSALRPRGPRLGRGWYLAAVLSAALAVVMCLLGWRQADQADRIAAHPVRVEGTVTQLPSGSATYSGVSYRADGQLRTAADLWLPGDVKVGDSICLEHAAADPGAVRVCGERYPQPVGISLARISVPIALLLFAGCAFRIWRHSRRVPRVGRARVTVAFAAEGMPALTNGKRSRRKRRRRR
ncbi:hypothetical protein CFP65_4470 [Kitasatospora sp. MMS16-BH015]|uniref:hypothetical protein n=1 Tax=Kitasatospora sp. MMS16-BH015 TaxID=2018025 RepID=UPI000CA0B5F4|nr:hypothetical protein [Kitasatospora sp. MMS16-BH015]AUG79217.1 hypothetical protein CFP65_4470 [Kitasatospora sp. MMS16-BH015]